MIWGRFILAFVVSNFVGASKLSEAEFFGSFAGQIRGGRIDEFEMKNRYKSRVAQCNWDTLHITH